MNVQAPLTIQDTPLCPRVGEEPSYADPAQPVSALTPASFEAPIVHSGGVLDTGTVATKGIIESLYPSAVNAALREDAHSRFIKSESIVSIAKDLGVDENVVKHWVMNGHWLEERQILLQATAGEDALILNELRIARRRDILKKQLDTAAALRTQIDYIVNETEELTASQVKLAAEGAKLVADVEARALGLCESGEIAPVQEQDKEKVLDKEYYQEEKEFPFI